MDNYDTTSNVYFVNNYFGSFYSGIRLWVQNELYPRLKVSYLSTYDKAVQQFKQKIEQHHDGQGPNYLPAMNLDPSYDFEPWDGDGRQFWAYPYLSPGLGNKLFEQIASTEDQRVQITPIFTRYNGVFEMLFWVNSVYELMDLRVLLYRFFGGLGRFVRPKMFESFIIIPDEIYNLEIDGQKLDWTNTPVIFKNVSNIGKNIHVLPFVLQPMFRLSSITDQSQKYGGSEISEYKLSVSLEWLCNFPTYFRVDGHNIIEKIALGIQSFSCLDSKYNTQIAKMSNQTFSNLNSSIPLTIIDENKRADEITNQEINQDEIVSYISPDIKSKYSFLFSYTRRYIYEFEELDIQNFEEFGVIKIKNPWDEISLSNENIIFKMYSYEGEILKNLITLNSITNEFIIAFNPKLDEQIEIYGYDKKV